MNHSSIKRKLRVPVAFSEFLAALRIRARPTMLATLSDEAPDDGSLREDILVVEVRGGFCKWIHLRCPQCGEAIQLPAGGGRHSWNIEIDGWWRPTVRPSVWQTGSCGAHFFVTRGRIEWCQ